METTERLQRVLAARGIASRRKAEDLIREGRVRVDGEVVTQLGVQVDPRSARIEVDGRPLRPQRMRYILLNKPSGYITTTSDERDRRTVLDLVSVPERVYPVGRLDRDTDGLLLLTNDGDVANRVMHPRYGLTKEYNVLTKGRPSEQALERVRRGVVVDGKRVIPEAFRILRETHDGVILTMTIHEGMNRVVRRMMEEVGIPVVRLRRVRIGPLSVAGIPVGTWRELTPGELGSLLEALRLQEPEQAAAMPATPRRSRPTRGQGRQSSQAKTETGAEGRPATPTRGERRSAERPAKPDRGGKPNQRGRRAAPRVGNEMESTAEPPRRGRSPASPSGPPSGARSDRSSDAPTRSDHSGPGGRGRRRDEPEAVPKHTPARARRGVQRPPADDARSARSEPKDRPRRGHQRHGERRSSTPRERQRNRGGQGSDAPRNQRTDDDRS